MFDALQARTERSFAERNQQDREHAEILKLEASLQGKSSEEIQRQVDLLRAKQEAERGGLAISSEAVQNRLKEVNALADANAMLARQRELWGQIQEIGGVFENAFSRAFDGIADGTFKLGAAIKSLAQDLIKTFASQAFKQLLHGNAGDSGGGIMGMLFGGGGFGKLFGLGGTDYDAINNAPGMGGGGDIPAFAGGGSFRVGGSGAIDSQLVRFRASPGEMVNISHGNDNGGGYGEPIRIVLQHDAAFVGGIADQRIVTRSGQIVEVAVRQSQQATQRNFGAYTAQARARTL